jgi:hypothetical protein
VWRRKQKLTADSFAHDPLARRIFVRSQREHKKREASDAFWDSAWTSTTLRGNTIAAVPFYLLFALLWGIVSALFEEIALYARALRDKIRVRRRNKYVRRARQYRPHSAL